MYIIVIINRLGLLDKVANSASGEVCSSLEWRIFKDDNVETIFHEKYQIKKKKKLISFVNQSQIFVIKGKKYII